MPNHVKLNKFFCITCIALLTFTCQESKKEILTKRLEEIATQKYLPGFAVSVVNDTEIIYQNAFGFANLESKKRYKTSTIQSIASISKTTIGIALMKLVEQGQLKLSTPINDIVPFKIFNPNFRSDPIRIIHLATHTSGIVDTENNYDDRNKYFISETLIDKKKTPTDWLSYFDTWKSNKALTLSEYCNKTLKEDGEWYRVDSYSKYKPGEHYQYSNIGANLAAYIIELVSDKTFKDFTKDFIFHPLSMHDVAWNIDEIDKNELATSYVTEDLLATPFFGNSTYADGGLYASCQDLSKYLLEVIKGYNGQGTLLDIKSFEEMFEKHLPDGLTKQSNQKKIMNSGVFWMHSVNGSIYHNGGNPLGGTIYMWFNPTNNTGRILMTNYLVEEKESYVQFMDIWKALEEYSLKSTESSL